MQRSRRGVLALKLLLDTNAYVALRNGNSEVIGIVREAESLVLSVVVVGELLFGFRHGSRFRHNAASLEDFIDQPQVSLKDVTYSTANHFGVISASLRKRGTPIPTNDVWIASHVLETGSELLTFDKHFEEVENLPKIIL